MIKQISKNKKARRNYYQLNKQLLEESQSHEQLQREYGTRMIWVINQMTNKEQELEKEVQDLKQQLLNQKR